MFLKSIFLVKNYTIHKAELEYTAPGKPSAIYNDFWKSEERYWDLEPSRCYAIVTKCLKSIRKVPKEVSETVLHLKYTYDGKEYECVTTDLEKEWPPIESEARFRMPIKKAMLMDKDGAPVRDVTSDLLRVMGPRKNFHDEDVTVRYLFDWDDYENICLTDIVNSDRTYHKTTSCLDLL
jgi:hypothetical protein